MFQNSPLYDHLKSAGVENVDSEAAKRTEMSEIFQYTKEKPSENTENKNYTWNLLSTLSNLEKHYKQMVIAYPTTFLQSTVLKFATCYIHVFILYTYFVF